MSVRLDGTFKAVTEKFVRATHPNGLQTNAYAVAKRMSTENVNNVNSMIVSAGRAAFVNDKFSQDIFEYAFRECFEESQMDIYSALLASSGSDIGKLLKETASSTDDLVKIQSIDEFNIRIAPLHDEFQKSYERKRDLRRNLRGAFDIDVIPVADGKSWMSAVGWIVHNVKTNATDAEINELFASELRSPLSASACDRIRQVKSILQTLVSSHDLKGICEALAQTIGSNSEDRHTAVITGQIDRAVTWQQILNRCEAVHREAVNLTDYRRAAELSTVSSSLIDFSRSHESFAPGRLPSYALQAHDEETGARDGAQKKPTTLEMARMYRYSVEGVISKFEGKHNDALVFHILMYAGIDFDIMDLSTKAGQGIERPRANVPLRWHSLYPYLEAFFKDLWKCFVPDAHKLEFYTQLSTLATKNGMKPIAIDKEVPALINALRKDIEGIITEVKRLGATGKGISIDEIINDFMDEMIQYEEEVVTPFDDFSLTTLTDASTFIRNGVVSVESSRFIGSVAHPSTRGVGYAEGIIGMNKDAFGAITHSAPMSEVAELYNRVSDFTSVSGSRIDVPLSLSRVIAGALYDVTRNIIKVNKNEAHTLLGSEVVEKAHFQHLGEDFYAFVKDTEISPLLLASGGASVEITVHAAGNVHGAFAYGLMKPRSTNSLSGDFDDTVNGILARAMKLLIDGYIPRAVKVEKKTNSALKFDEKNAKYAKRIAELPLKFTDSADIDRNLLQAMASSPMINNTVEKVVNKELLLFARAVEPRVRTDTSAYLDIIGDRQVQVLTGTYSLQVLNLFHAMLTRPLSQAERVMLMRPEFASTCQAISADLTKVMDGLSPVLRTVYTMVLFEKLAVLPAFDGDKSEKLSVIGDE